jgi:hypothetical protein
MNHKHYKIFNYSFILILIASIIVLQFFPKFVYSLESDKDTPKVNIGAGGSFEYCNVNHIGNNNMDWQPGYCYGGGLVFESMYSDTFGLHSGLWFTHSVIKAKFSNDSSSTGEKITHTMKTNMFTMPFYLVTSLDSGFVTLNLLSGLNFSYIVESRMTPSPDDKGSGSSNGDIKKFLGYGQIGAGAGIEFLFKITKFTRLFISFTGEYYFVSLITDQKDGSIDHLYGANARAGFMLSTF